MKLALLQCDVLDGKITENCAKIIAFCRKAQAADLRIAPAEALAGPGLTAVNSNAAQTALNRLASESPGALLCALPDRGAFLLEAGKIAPIQDSFDFQGRRICLLGAENTTVDISLNLASRPFAPNVQADWELVLAGAAMQTNSYAVSINLAGGYDSHIYNGQSVAFARDGSLAGRAKAFAEDILILDTESQGRIEPTFENHLAAQWAALKLGLADFVAKAGARCALLGLSGGMDSALVACIAAEALGPENVAGILMPSGYTSAESLRDANELARNLDIKTFTLPIAPILAAYKSGLAPAFAQIAAVANDLTEENLQARIRGVLLMALANRSGALVLNTGNKSEAAMGYSTLYGDTVGAVAVIGDLFKTEVYSLASWYCANYGQKIPQNIFERPPTAELRPGQKDTDSLPPYDQLDPKLAEILRACGQGSPALRKTVESFEFKRRQCPPPLLVSGLPLARFCREAE